MSIIDMAKAHLQNVHARIEDLQKQKQLIDEEINKLTSYITNGLADIAEAEAEEDSLDSKVSTK